MILSCIGRYVGSSSKEFTNRETGEVSERVKVSIYQENEGSFDFGIDNSFDKKRLSELNFGDTYNFDLTITNFNGNTYYKIKDFIKYVS